MEKSSQLPKAEGCSGEGEPVDLLYYRGERPLRSVLREKREPQAGPASCLSNAASIVQEASGDGVCLPEPKTNTSAEGEGVEGLPGSKSVARAEADARNRGGPESPCRTNNEGQAGRVAQRQEATPGAPGVGSAHTIQPQGASPEAGEGVDKSTQSRQATRTVRMTEANWQTFLRAIAEKASTTKTWECLALRNVNGCWSFGGWGQSSGRMRERVDLKSPVREYRPPGSVRGAPGN